MRNLLMIPLLSVVLAGACNKDNGNNGDGNALTTARMIGQWNGEEGVGQGYFNDSIFIQFTEDLSHLSADFKINGDYVIDSAGILIEKGKWKVISKGSRFVFDTEGGRSDTNEIYMLSRSSFIFGKDYVEPGLEIEMRIRFTR